jgi:hypothetical protein
MKNLIVFIMLILAFNCFAQEAGKSESDNPYPGNNEIKLNMGYLIGGIAEISYERILSDESSAGISVAAVFDDSIDFEYLIIPYYRFYFGRKRNAGFFFEANAAYFTEQTDNTPVRSESGLGLGLAVGGKFLTKKGWILELVGGLGRNFVNEDIISGVYPRVGISVGKRF